MVECADLESVFQAVEKEWAARSLRGSRQPGIYQHLVTVLADKGFIVDTQDGLSILEHCRRRGLLIIDVLYALDARLRDAGYRGGALSMADLSQGSRNIFVFFDPNRFDRYAQVCDLVSIG